MPIKGKGGGYHARKSGKGYAIVNRTTGKTVGHSKTKAKAKRNANLRNAVAHGWRPTGKR